MNDANNGVRNNNNDDINDDYNADCRREMENCRDRLEGCKNMIKDFIFGGGSRRVNNVNSFPD